MLPPVHFPHFIASVPMLVWSMSCTRAQTNALVRLLHWHLSFSILAHGSTVLLGVLWNEVCYLNDCAMAVGVGMSAARDICHASNESLRSRFALHVQTWVTLCAQKFVGALFICVLDKHAVGTLAHKCQCASVSTVQYIKGCHSRVHAAWMR